MGFVDSIRAPRIIGNVIDSQIRLLINTPGNAIKTVLLLGGDDGTGLAQTLYAMALKKYQPPLAVQPLRIYVNEHSPDKFELLSQKFSSNPIIRIYDYYPATAVMTASDVHSYYSTSTRKKALTIHEALRGAAEETELWGDSVDDGVSAIRDDAGLDYFDLVIVDGAWFTGDDQVDELKTSKFILLLDHNTIKNGTLYESLIADGFTRVAIQKSTAMDDAFNNGAGVALLRRTDFKQLRPDGSKKKRPDGSFKLRA